MPRLKILITNICLKSRSGTEVVTIELAQGLAARGHEVVVFTPELGASAKSLGGANIRVTDRLDNLDFEPDVIHGNHSVDLVMSLIAFPGTPALFVCHSSTHWFCSPPDLSRVRAFVSVDRICRARIARDLPRVRDLIRIVHNAVDLERYGPRERLPQKPSKALVFCKFSGSSPVIRAACQQAGLEVEVVGPGVGLVVDDLPERLRNVDVVFATARMAIEAMAVGCAVIVVDDRGLAGMVTKDVVVDWRDHNFGLAILTRPVTADSLIEEILRYDAVEAARVSEYVRANNNLDRALSIYEAIYLEVADNNRSIAPKVEAREMSRLMSYWLPSLSGDPQLLKRFQADATEDGLWSPLRTVLNQLKEVELDRSARLEQIHSLTALLKESEADRSARLEQIHSLTALLENSEADRSARLEQIHILTALLKDLKEGI